jgi:nucleotide-binding universal stress UspA family protein
MLRRILVPLDGSPFANAALPPAAALARRTGAQLRLLHVVEVPAALAYPEYRAEDRAWAEQYLAELATAEAPAGVAVSTSVREGRILEQIQKELADWKADLMVMTTHGRGGVSRLWMGSVADRCVRSSAVPVLLVRPNEKVSLPTPSFAPVRVIVPLDGSAIAESALPHATALAKAFGARLVLLQGLAHFGALDGAHLSLNPTRIERERTESEAYLEERAEAARRAGVEVELMVVTEPGLAEAIAARAPDEVIVMTTNGKGGLDRAVFGSVADKVVRSATCPVMVVRPERSAEGRALEALSREIADATASLAVAAADRS